MKTLQRSKKYSTYSDDQLIDLFCHDGLKGQNKHFLYVELEFRQLLQKAEQQKVLQDKSKPRNVKMIIFTLIMAAAFSIRFIKGLL